MSSPIYPPDMANRLSAIRAALNVGLVVRQTLAEMKDVVGHLARYDMVPAGCRPQARHVIDAFKLESLAITWDNTAKDFLWMLVPPGARAPHGELGGGAAVVTLRWGPTGNAQYEHAGSFRPATMFLDAMAEECESRASGGPAGGVPCVPCRFSSQTGINQN